MSDSSAIGGTTLFALADAVTATRRPCGIAASRGDGGADADRAADVLHVAMSRLPDHDGIVALCHAIAEDVAQPAARPVVLHVEHLEGTPDLATPSMKTIAAIGWIVLRHRDAVGRCVRGTVIQSCTHTPEVDRVRDAVLAACRAVSLDLELVVGAEAARRALLRRLQA